MDLHVHHLDNSRSQRILWLLEELGLPYQLTEWKRGADMRAPKGLRDIHPLGFAPILVVDGQVLAESGAILDSVLDRVPEQTLRPTEVGPQLDAYRFWLHYAEGSVMPPLLVKLLTGKLATDAPFLARPVTGAVGKALDSAYTDPQIRRHLRFIDTHLDGREWLLDTFSAADIQMAFPLLASRKRTAGDHRHIAAWLDRCEARPAFRTAMEKGGPLRF
jgi:glutathione S-transferase